MNQESRPDWVPPWHHERRSGRFEGLPRRTGKGFTLPAAVFAGLVQIISAKAAYGHGLVYRPMDAVAYLLLLAGPFALLWRRVAPVPVFLVASAASIAFGVQADPRWMYAVAPAIALFAVARRGWGRIAIGVSVPVYVAYLLITSVFAARLDLAAGTRPSLGQAILLGVGMFLMIFLGRAAKERSEQMAEMIKVRAARAKAQEEQEKRQASEERLRIARELHDVLGHHLSLINVQAGVGLHLMDNRPEQAREALTAIKTASAEALREVRSVLGVLRTEDEAAPRQPALGLTRLDDLTAGAGLPVTTTVTGEARELPAEVDRAAYRIVQEALTNVRKHAGPAASATVGVDYLPTSLHLAIRNDGVSPAARADDSGADAGVDSSDITDLSDMSAEVGSGIAGMRERAQSLGGRLEAGPVEGGYLVSALLPTGGDAA